MYEKLEQEVKEMREQGKMILMMGDFNGRKTSTGLPK